MTATLQRTTTIREAVEGDVPRIVEMGQRFRRESAYADCLDENPVQMAAIARKLIDSPDGVIYVAESEGLVIGFIGLLLFRHHLSDALTVGEVAFWIEPEYRGCGVRMVRLAELWATSRDATTLQMIAPSPEVGRFYERLQFHALEVAYEKRLTCQ